MPASLTPLRARNAANRRQGILDATRDIIAREGLAALNMRRLAEKAGVAVKTLYNHYGSREAILDALVSDAMDRMDSAFEAEAPLTDPLARARAVVTISIRIVREDEALHRAMVLARLAAPDTGVRRLGRSERAVQMQGVAVRAATRQGLLDPTRDADELARQIFRCWELAHIQWALNAIDAETFKAQALYGLYITLLGAATGASRQLLTTELENAERALRKLRPSSGGNSGAQPLTAEI